MEASPTSKRGYFALVAIALICGLLASTSSSSAQSESVIYNFDCYHYWVKGCAPSGNLVEQNGVLFGVNDSGGVGSAQGIDGNGVVYALTPPTTPGGQWSDLVLYQFPRGVRGIPPAPSPSLLAGANNTLYGTTGSGGPLGYGTVYSLAPPANRGAPWIATTLYNFNGASHVLQPNGGLIADSSGTLYGTAAQGDAPCPMPPFNTNLCGGIFSLSPPSTPGGAWTERRLYSFSNVGTDGYFPNGPLLLGKNGVLYGTTQGGGGITAQDCPQGCGVVYSLTPPASSGGAWTEQILYRFTGKLDGTVPLGPLIADKSGRLFGTCSGGGDNNVIFGGTAFELTPPATPGGPWTEHTIWTFGVAAGDGQVPGLGLTQGNGVFYGVTGAIGGANQVVFQLTPPSVLGNPWTETILHTFPDSATDGYAPSSGLLLTQSGTLYGTTSAGGAINQGTAYEVTP